MIYVYAHTYIHIILSGSLWRCPYCQLYGKFCIWSNLLTCFVFVTHKNAIKFYLTLILVFLFTVGQPHRFAPTTWKSNSPRFEWCQQDPKRLRFGSSKYSWTIPQPVYFCNTFSYGAFQDVKQLAIFFLTCDR